MHPQPSVHTSESRYPRQRWVPAFAGTTVWGNGALVILSSELLAQLRGAPRLVDLARPRDRQRILRHVLGDDAAGRDISAIADRNRRDQSRVRPDKHVVADDGPVLVEAVVIAGDRAGADIRAGADLAVAEIGEMVGLGAPAQPGRLHFDEIADMHLGFEHRAGAEPRERA